MPRPRKIQQKTQPKTLDKDDIIQIFINEPYIIGHLVGFTKLTKKLHNEWIKMMIGDRKTMWDDETLQAHRNSYKTTCVAIALVVIIIMYPMDTTLFMRKTDDDVKEIIETVKKILMHEVIQAFVHVLYGKALVLTVSNATSISTNLNDGVSGTNQLTGMGSKSSLTGKHYDRVFTDDIVNIEDRSSKAERERIKTVYQELQNIKKDNGRIFNTGTPWHKDDAFTKMPKPKKWTWKDTGILTEEKIKILKESMTNSLFAANYELKHIASEDVIFDNPVTGAEPSLVEQGTSHTDAAYWGEDTTAFTIIKRHGEKIYVFGKVWEKHVDNCMDQIELWHKKFMCNKMWNERNADKGYLAQQFRKRGITVVSYDENENKFIKITSYLKFEWKNVVFVEGTDQKYIDQITDFNENADHDDCADSLASLIRAVGGKKNDTYKPLWNT